MKPFATVVLLSACACAHASSGMVHGTVTTTSGQPITNGSIQFTVNGVNASPVPIDNLGTYSKIVTWQGAASAACIIQATSPGFVDQINNATVQPGGSTESDFILAIDPDYIFSADFEGAG